MGGTPAYFAEGRSIPAASLPIEAARHIRGECGTRQVPNAKRWLVNGVGGMLSAAGTFVLAQSTGASTGGDPRLDKILEQNEKILKNQEEILKQVNQTKDWVDWLRRRSS